MAEWKKYTGSDEQIAEMKASRDVIIRFKSSYELLRSSCFVDDFNDRLANGTVTAYLICDPHPYADMICQQARTGQEVWVLEPVVGTEEHPLWPRLLAEGISRENVGPALLENGIFCQYSTRTPYWHIPGAKYSFTRVGGYRANK